MFVNIFKVFFVEEMQEKEEDEEEQFVLIEFLGLPDPSILRQKGICTMLVNKRINKIIMTYLMTAATGC